MRAVYLSHLRVVRVTLFFALIKGPVIRSIERRISSEALDQIRVGQKGDTEGDEVRLSPADHSIAGGCVVATVHDIRPREQLAQDRCQPRAAGGWSGGPGKRLEDVEVSELEAAQFFCQERVGCDRIRIGHGKGRKI